MTRFMAEFEKKIFENASAKDIYYAGKRYKQFSYDKGLDALIKTDKTGEFIYLAGRDWEQFNYKKGSDALIKVDKIGRYVYYAGLDWKQFDYRKGFGHLKKISSNEYYRKANIEWPKSANQMLDKIHDELKNTKKIEPKRYKL